MRNQYPKKVEAGRVSNGHYASAPNDRFGAFFVQLKPGGPRFKIIVGDGCAELPWEHVSVSLPKRCPAWDEMCQIKDFFWDEDELVVQFHPPRAEYVNNHLYCLHMWRHLEQEFPMPPSIAVGFKGLEAEELNSLMKEAAS